jgi:outer membrane lipoprotein carrier protein
MFRFFLSLLLLSAVATSQAQETPVERLKKALQSVTSLQAGFTQMTYDQLGNVDHRGTGTFYLQKPGKFRWDYKEPFHQEVVTSGGKVWFYDADLEQVTVKKVDAAIGSTPALLLTGEISVMDNFTLENQGENEGLSWVRLIPKNEDSGFKHITVGLEKESIVGMELADNFGHLTRIYFQDIKPGVKIDPARFEFKAPPGVDVFEDK